MPPEPSYSTAEADARFLPKALATGVLWLRNETTGSASRIAYRGDDASPALTILRPEEVTPEATYRINANGDIEIVNLDTGTFFPTVARGTDAAPEIYTLPPV